MSLNNLSVYTREISNDFQIDNIPMPKPHEWAVYPNPVSQDAERLPGTGRMINPYLTMCWTIEWKYKYLSADQYDLLYDAYILSCVRNRSLYHTIRTRDSNSDSVKDFEIYTQSDFKAPLYRIKNGVRYYRDITFTFITRGGDEYDDDGQ